MARTLLTIAALSVLAGASLPAAATPVADPTAQPPVTVAFSLSSASVIQYEPVILHYQIINHASSDTKVSFAGQERPAAWLGLQCIGPDGSPVEQVKSLDLPRWLVSGRGCIGPAESLHGAVVLQRMFDISEPRRYSLRITPSLAWASEDKSRQGIVTSSQVLPFEVGSPDSTRLSRMMDALLIKALGRREDYAARTTAIQALFSIPETEALRAWERLLEQAIMDGNDTVVGMAVEEMVRVPTSARADLLAEIVWGRYRAWLDLASPGIESRAGGLLVINPGPLVLAAASRGLHNMYWAGDASLKEHIRDLFIKHEGAMPDIKNPIIH